MSKRKLPKSLTTVTPFSKLIALVLFILLPFLGFYFGMKYEKKFRVPIKTQTSYSMYTEPDNAFSLQYPSNWKIELSEKDPQYAAYTEVPEDKLDVSLSGSEGSIDISWADGFGGACPDNYETIEFNNKSFGVCHFADETGEHWEQISEILYPRTNLGVGVWAKANQPVEKNRDVILGILSSLQFNQQ